MSNHNQWLRSRTESNAWPSAHFREMSFFQPGILWRNSQVTPKRIHVGSCRFWFFSLRDHFHVDFVFHWQWCLGCFSWIESQLWRGIQSKTRAVEPRRPAGGGRSHWWKTKLELMTSHSKLCPSLNTSKVMQEQHARCDLALENSCVSSCRSRRSQPSRMWRPWPQWRLQLKNQVSGVAKSFLADHVIAFKDRNGAFWK